MGTWKDKWIKVAGDSPEVQIDYFYITGSDMTPDDYAKQSGQRVTDRAKQHVSSADSTFHFVGAAKLWAQVQKRPPKSKTLKWSDTPTNTDEGSVGLVRLKDYLDFIEDEPGLLAERYFESNVQGYHDVAVNQEIAASLSGDHSNNFWLLNNGITITTPKLTQEASKRVSIQDPQIVNGFQTSREIFNFFSKNGDADDNRFVLVRVIEADDSALQSQINKATNSQNKMPPSQLRMTDQIHRNIEEFFKKQGMFYDRRKGFYRDQGKSVKAIVSPGKVAQAVIAVLLQRPDDARARPGDHFKDSKGDVRYASIFGAGTYSMQAYWRVFKLMRAVEFYLRKVGLSRAMQRNLKFYVASEIAVEKAGMANPPLAKIATLADISEPTDTDI